MKKLAKPLSFSPAQEMSHPLLELRYCLDHAVPKVSLHAHVFYEFYVFAGGDLERYVVGQKNYHLEPGDILVIPPRVLHHPVFRSGTTRPYLRYYIWAAKEYIESLRQFPQSDYCLQICAEQGEYLIRPPEFHRRRLLKQLEAAWDEVCTQQICNDLYLHAHCLRFIADLNNYILRTDGQPRDIGNQRSDMMEEALAYIHGNFSEALTLRSAAARLHVSISTIENLFNKIIGRPFYSYVTEYRITTAQALILDGIPLQEVSRRCGYTDYSTFFKAFTKHVGSSPSNYRRAAPKP